MARPFDVSAYLERIHAAPPERPGAGPRGAPAAQQHLLEVLEEHFGLVFPPDTRFAKPEF